LWRPRGAAAEDNLTPGPSSGGQGESWEQGLLDRKDLVVDFARDLAVPVGSRTLGMTESRMAKAREEPTRDAHVARKPGLAAGHIHEFDPLTLESSVPI
jgi:hypothetical protein